MRQLQHKPTANGADREETMSVARAETELTHLQSEYSRLQSQLDEVRQRIVKIQNYIEMAREFETTTSTPHPTESPEIRSRVPKGGIGGQASRLAIEMVRERRQPIPTRELVEMLKVRGVDVGGGNPVTTLSSYLSRVPELSADRSRGWSLKEWVSTGEYDSH
jgi:hypothetical protein